MLKTKTALGIDISEKQINLALLKRDTNGIRLLKAASGPIPDGVIKNGNIEEPAMFCKAIRELKSRNKIRPHQAAISLCVKPTLVQIIDMPERLPTNIGRFVQNEVKRCVALSGKEIVSDFCAIRSGGQPGSRLFVVATDGQRVTEFARICRQTGLSIAAIEATLPAYIRALYAKKVAGKFDCNVLLAALEHDVLTLCVFRKQILDFVRTKSIESKISPDELCGWLADQLNAIMQFYSVEVPDSPARWEITVVTNCVYEESLKAELVHRTTNSANANLQVSTPESACKDTPVGQDTGCEQASPVAIGLAMKLLGIDQSGLRINLLPSETAEIKSAKKDALIAANVVAAVLLLMILAVGGLGLMTKRVNENINYKKQTELSYDTRTLLRGQELVDRQIEQLSDAPASLESILSSRPVLDWAGILSNVRSSTPKTVRVTKLLSKGSSSMYLEGIAMSYEAVHLFVNALNSSGYIESASLVETEKDRKDAMLVKYAINCSLALGKEK